MSSNTCPNCNVCFCTGASPLKAQDGRVCCTACVTAVNEEIRLFLISNPTLTVYDLRRQNKNK